MKTKQTVQLIGLAGAILLAALTPAVLGQGTINFNPIPPSLGESPNETCNRCDFVIEKQKRLEMPVNIG